ncbi:MAG: hypothetical protein JOY62_04160 [Acidobacteriaceae bacterium]|nr:hypothetical protein [Acidobacteriaceae bacterium]MBV9779147.1 hypothetical protein [Acidobacteriaceae bacterium]
MAAQQNKLTVEPVKELTIKPGGTAVETLRVVVEPSFHVNSDKPKDEFVIPLKLTWIRGPLETEYTHYPAAEEIKVGDQMLTVFTGAFNIETEFKAPESSTPGTSMMTGKLRYQACNNQMCFRPATLEIRLPVLFQ